MSSTTTNKIPLLIARILLGLIYFVFGLNFFLHFIPNKMPPDPKAAAFVGGLFQSGYFFPYMKVIEIIGGALLLTGLFVPLVLVVLMPITLNILLFDTILAPSGAILGILMILIQLYLAARYWNYYKQLFMVKAIAQ